MTLIEKGLIDGEYLQKMKADVIDVLKPEPEQIVDMDHFLEEQQQMLREKVAKECSRSGGSKFISTHSGRHVPTSFAAPTSLPHPLVQSSAKSNKQTGPKFCHCPPGPNLCHCTPGPNFCHCPPAKNEESIVKRVFFQNCRK